MQPANFREFVRLIGEKSPLQRKSLEAYLNKQDAKFWERAGLFFDKFSQYLEKNSLTHELVADAYLKLCKDMLSEQIKFKKTGKYSATSASEVNKKVYSSEAEMSLMVYGLAISQFLWPNHYAMFDFFLTQSSQQRDVQRYLEIGPGHGLHLVYASEFFKGSLLKAVDISPVSVRICKAMLATFAPTAQVSFDLVDVNEMPADDQSKFDYIVISEVLEHVEDPLSILKKLYDLVDDNGRVFITTCANAPSVDHIYLYDSVEHMRDHCKQAGFTIETELALPVGNYERSQWKELKVEINYAAVLSKN